MNNPHIELLKKWLADPESVSAEERQRAADAADAVAAAAAGAADDDDTYAKYWLERYEELTESKTPKQKYLKNGSLTLKW